MSYLQLELRFFKNEVVLLTPRLLRLLHPDLAVDLHHAVFHQLSRVVAWVYGQREGVLWKWNVERFE